MEAIKDILNSFDPIGLRDMDRVKLMDRIDTKFSFMASRLPAILEKLKEHYNVLSIEGTRICAYKTLYYDTEDLNLYLAHHNERVNRYKIRHRSYVDSNVGFMEVKFKNNKNHTIKERIKQNDGGELLSEESKQFISNYSTVNATLLKPSVRINYRRITLVGANERVTIDLDLEFLKDSKRVELPAMVIAEVKQSKYKTSPVFAILKEERLRQVSISKYCLGIIFTYPGVKQNNFKQQIRTIKKLSS